MNPTSLLKGKNILITGGLGFIGSNLTLACYAQGAKVTILDCMDPTSGCNLQNISGIEQGVQVLKGDIRDTKAVQQAITDVEIIFNCAAYTSHPNSISNPLHDIDVNCRGVIILLEAVKKLCPEARFVHVGTTTQIGKMIYNPIDELHPEFPRDIYSASKSASEKYVLVYGRVFGLDVSVVRLCNTFGPRANIKNSDLGFVNYFIGLALQGKKIHIFGDGKQIRTFLYVEDAVGALLSAAVKKKSRGEVFMAGGRLRYSVGAIAREITKKIGGTITYVPWPPDRKSIEIGDAVIDTTKITTILGWKPLYNLSTGLTKTKEYYERCLEKYL